MSGSAALQKNVIASSTANSHAKCAPAKTPSHAIVPATPARRATRRRLAPRSASHPQSCGATMRVNCGRDISTPISTADMPAPSKYRLKNGANAPM